MERFMDSMFSLEPVAFVALILQDLAAHQGPESLLTTAESDQFRGKESKS